MKEKWTAGKPGGCVVSDTPNRHSTADDHVDYYGGYLVAESIPAQKYVDLIAAAPELLEACEVCLELGDTISASFDPGELRAMLRAVIAKAKGEES